MNDRLPAEEPMAAAVGSPAQGALAHGEGVLALRDAAERAREIGDLHGGSIVPALAGLLVDAEENPALRALLVGALREAGR